MKRLRYVAVSCLALWLMLAALTARLAGQNSLDPFNFVRIGTVVRIVWNYPFEVAQAVRLNGIRFADQFPTITAACNDMPQGGMLFLPSGAYQPAAQIACNSATMFVGAGVNQSIVKPTNALGATLFSVAVGAEGWKFQDFTVDMSNAGSQNVFDVNVGANRPLWENVRILYPAGASGKSFNFINAGEPHVRNVMQRNGDGIYYNGDSASEALFDDIVIESATNSCFQVNRTNATDIGGFYLQHVKCTNPGNQANNKSFVVTSTVSNTAGVLFLTDSVGDNALGGPALSATNFNLIEVSHSWFTTGTGNTSGAITLNGVSDFIMDGGHIQSSAVGSDLTLASGSTNGSLNLSNIQFRGANKSIVASGSTLSNYYQQNLSFSVSPAGADEVVLAGAAPGQVFRYGMWIGTQNSGGQASEFCLVNKTVASPTTPFKCVRVGSSGELQVLDHANTTILSQLTNGGDYYVNGHITQPVSNRYAGTCVFSASTTCTVTYSPSFNSVPVVFIQPVNPGSTTFTVTASSQFALTITASASNSLTVNWLAIGNPN